MGEAAKKTEQSTPLKKEKGSGSISRKNKKVLIGMTGGVDSTMTAFLLKKQGYDCIGITLVNLDHDLSDKYNELLKFPGCQISPLEEIKGICKRLEIPFYAVNMKAEYYEIVIENFVAAKLMGNQFTLTVPTHSMILETLEKKSNELGANYIASGHYAKVHFHQDKKKYYLHMANDLEHDQSHYIARQKQKVLKKLILPLGDTRRVEIEKLLQNFQYNAQVRNRLDENELYYSEQLSDFVNSRSDNFMREEGQILQIKTESSFGDHNGVHRFSAGQGEITSSISGYAIDKNLKVVKIIPQRKQVFLGLETELKSRGCTLTNLKFVEGIDYSTVLKVGIKFNHTSSVVSGTLYPKNNRSAVLTFDEEVDMVVAKQFITLYNKIGKAGQVLASGQVSMIGTFPPIHRASSVMNQDKDEFGEPIPIIGNYFAF